MKNETKSIVTIIEEVCEDVCENSVSTEIR